MQVPHSRYSRVNSLPGPKHQLIGKQASYASPAWSPTAAAAPPLKSKNAVVEHGSKILLSRLPVDVGEEEVEELFRKTVGPVKESFLIYNSQGRSKGMAIVAFQRSGDAAAARAKYDGKIVDGRRPLKIETITDGAPSIAVNPAPQALTLLERLGVTTGPSTSNTPVASLMPIPPFQPPRPSTSQPHFMSVAARPALGAHTILIRPRRLRQKKGPRRMKKDVQQRTLRPRTVDQLDKEMDEYRAAGP